MKLILSTLFLLYSFNLSAQEIPKGRYIADSKSFIYNGWKISEGDSLTMSDSSKAVVLDIKKYAQEEVDNYVYYVRLKIGETKNFYNFYKEIHNGKILMPEGILLSENTNSITNRNDFSNGYLGSNGVRYYVGDTIKLGRGSGVNGHFVYLFMGGWDAILVYNSKTGLPPVGPSHAGYTGRIKSIKNYRYRGQEKVYFILKGGFLNNYSLDIENAIQSCEIENCKAITASQIIQPLSPADEILKYKKLLDAGIITNEEFEKKKLDLLK